MAKEIEKNSLNEKKEKSKSSAKSSKDKKSSLWFKIKKYFKDLKSEFKKVVWPTKKQVFHNTLVVLVSMFVVGLFIFGLDTGLLKLLEVILK